MYPQYAIGHSCTHCRLYSELCVLLSQLDALDCYLFLLHMHYSLYITQHTHTHTHNTHTHTHNTHTHTQDWKDLAVLRGFGEYTQIFELKSHPVRYLLKKWGESPKWSIKALIAALECIDRMDVVHFIRSRFIQGR